MKLNLTSKWSWFVWPLAAASLVTGCGDVNDVIDAAVSGHHGQGGPACPNICEAVCAGEPEPETPPGCPIPSCSCAPPEVPECPADFCIRICAGEPEPETPPGCPIPSCSCSTE